MFDLSSQMRMPLCRAAAPRTAGDKVMRAVTTLMALSALAMTSVPGTRAAEPTKTAPSTLSMLEAMVASGVITQEQADKVLKDAEARDAARVARGEAVAPATGNRRVSFVPDLVKQQLRDEIKGQVMAQAKAENWAAPNKHPEWSERIKLKGDVRGRYEALYYPNGNLKGTTDLVNYNSINASSSALVLPAPGAVVTSPNKIPLYNADQNRERARIRARLAVEANLGDGLSTGMRIATGDGNSPVSTNQSLGGSGGSFSKYQMWLDRASIHWDAIKDKEARLGIDVGRFDTPFFGTDLVWDDDLGYDGMAVSGSYEIEKGVIPFLTIGAFPVFNTDLNLSSYDAAKTPSRNKWLYGLQAGTDWKPDTDVRVKVGAGYYHFKDIEGKKSSPCMAASYSGGSALDQTSIACDTDASRPSFAQKGNTYFALRDIPMSDGLGGVATKYAQYYGLATPFRELVLTGRAEYDGFKPLRVSADGEFVKNLAFNKNKIHALNPENNCVGATACEQFEGGDTGYLLRMSVGTPEMTRRWDWNVSLAYKYLESDAVVDGMADSDFGMGGTNVEGFILGGALALNKNVRTGLRWISADSIAGSRFSVDTVQFDLAAKF